MSSSVVQTKRAVCLDSDTWIEWQSTQCRSSQLR